MHKADITLHSTDEGLYLTFNCIRRHLRFFYSLVYAHLNFFLKIDFKFKKKKRNFSFLCVTFAEMPNGQVPVLEWKGQLLSEVSFE